MKRLLLFLFVLSLCNVYSQVKPVKAIYIGDAKTVDTTTFHVKAFDHKQKPLNVTAKRNIRVKKVNRLNLVVLDFNVPSKSDSIATFELRVIRPDSSLFHKKVNVMPLKSKQSHYSFQFNLNDNWVSEKYIFQLFRVQIGSKEPSLIYEDYFQIGL